MMKKILNKIKGLFSVYQPNSEYGKKIVENKINRELYIEAVHHMKANNLPSTTITLTDGEVITVENYEE